MCGKGGKRRGGDGGRKEEGEKEVGRRGEEGGRRWKRKEELQKKG